MLRVDRLLAQMRVALVEPAPKALVFALKRKVNAKVVAAVSQLLGSEEQTPLPNGEEEEGVYELERILDHDTRRDMFYCKW
eukprot:SAG11_NODE_6877_length_1232_cov_4.144748_1_plen_80_part_10